MIPGVEGMQGGARFPPGSCFWGRVSRTPLNKSQIATRARVTEYDLRPSFPWSWLEPEPVDRNV